MLRTVFGCFGNNKISDEKTVVVEPAKLTKAVCRDELTKKKSASKRVKKCVRFADSEPTILGEDKNEEDLVKKSNDQFGEKGGEVRVKVKMTKEEAARLLSKCQGGVLEFKDVARELVLIPVNRVSVVPTCTNNL